MVRLLIIILGTLLCAQFSIAAPNAISYQGQIIKPNGQPLEGTNVTFTLEVLSPTGSDCILYKEQHIINMSGSNGVFSLVLGQGTQGGGNFEDSNPLEQAMSNGTGTVNPTTCGTGTDYTPGNTDGRQLRVTFDDGSGAETLANQQIVSVPYAQNAQDAAMLDGFVANDFVRVNAPGLTQANLESVFDNGANQAELTALLAGSSTQYSPLSSNGASNLPTFTTATPPSSPQAGDMWLNSDTGAIMYYDGSTTQTVGSGTIDASQITSGTIANARLDLGTGANQIVQLNGSSQLPAVDGSLLTGVTGTDSSKLPLAGGNMTGALVMDAENEVRFADNDNSHYVGFKAPTTIAAGSSFVWELPDDDGSNGDVLTTNGAGVLSFTSLPSAPVDSVFGRTGVVVAAASDYDANQIDNTPAGGISATNVQAAIDELDSEKAISARNLTAGNGLTGGGDLSADRSFAVGAGAGITVNANDVAVNINGTTAETSVDGTSDEILIYDASATALRKMVRDNFVLSEAEVDAYANNNGYLTSFTEVDPGLQTLTTTEVDQLETIDSVTITNTQWGYLGAMSGQPLESETQSLDDAYNNGSSVTVDTSDVILNLTSTNDFQVQDNGTTAFIVNDSGNVGVGTTSPINVLSLSKDATNGDEGYIGLSVARDAVFGGGVHHQRYRGTIASPTAVQDGDMLASTSYAGYDGSALGFGATFNAYVDGAVSGGVVPGAFSFDVYNNLGARLDALEIKSNGNVGIGTTAPAGPLDVKGDGEVILERTNTSTNAHWGVLRLRRESSGTVVDGFGAGIAFDLEDSSGVNVNNVGAIDVGWEDSANANQAGYFAFSTKPAGGSLTERLRIDSSGNVGIGSNSPTSKLDVNGTVTATAFSGDGSALTGVSASDSSAGTSSSNYIINTDSDNAGSDGGVEVQTNGSTVARVTASGSVQSAGGSASTPGLSFTGDTDTGVYSPSANTLSMAAGGIEALRLNTVASGVNYVEITPAATGSGPIIGAAGSDTNIDLNLSPKGTGDTIFTSGNVGIGTTTPQSVLDIHGDGQIVDYTISDVTAHLNLLDTSGFAQDNGPVIAFSGNYNASNNKGTWATIKGADENGNGSFGNGYLSFSTAINDGTNTERMRIDSSGNVGIGTATPVTELHVSDSGATTILQIENTAVSGDPVLNLQTDGSTNWFMGVDDVDGDKLKFSAVGGDWKSGSMLMTLDTNGNLGIGSESPDAKIDITTAALGEFGGSNTDSIGSNLNLRGTAAARTVGEGPSMTFSMPADSDGTNFWEQARILASPATTGSGNARGRLYLQVRDNYDPGVGGVWNWRTGLMLDHDGDIGVGTTAPDAQLHIQGGLNDNLLRVGNGTQQILVGEDSDLSGFIRLRPTGGSGFGITGNNDDVGLFVDSSSNVGVGTASPGHLVHVEATSAGEGLVLRNGANTVASLENFSGASSKGLLTLHHGGTKTVHITGDSGEDSWINTNNVGIGTTTPTEKLEVDGDILVTGKIKTNNSWVNLTLSNSWVSYGGSFAPPSYKVFPDGIVRLRGLVRNGTSATAIVATLPAGVRPGYHHEYSAACFGTTTPCEVIVRSNGEIFFETGGSTSWSSLDGIWFEIGE